MRSLLFLTVLMFMLPATVEATGTFRHGISVRLALEGRLVVATCRYDGDVPVSGGEVRVFAPGSEEPYQTGRSDAAGYFAFLPAQPGNWRVLVDDGQGHRRQATIEVVEYDPAEAASDRVLADAASGAESRLWPLLTGMSLIIGLTGLAYGFTARRKKGAAA